MILGNPQWTLQSGINRSPEIEMIRIIRVHLLWIKRIRMILKNPQTTPQSGIVHCLGKAKPIRIIPLIPIRERKKKVKVNLLRILLSGIIHNRRIKMIRVTRIHQRRR